MSEEGGSLATKTEEGPRFFFLTMAEEGEWVGWEKARSSLPFLTLCLLGNWWKLQIGIGFLHTIDLEVQKR